MSKESQRLKIQRIGGAVLLASFLLLLATPLLHSIGVLDAVHHLIAGWFYFLRQNLGRISTDAATWIPGVGAFFVAVAVGHIFLKGWADRCGCRWSAGMTLALSMVLPVCFVISFLVPGMILQGRRLATTDWIRLSPSKPGGEQQYAVSRLRSELLEGTRDDPHAPFPVSLAELEGVKTGRWAGWVMSFGDPSPPELPIYLGDGFSIASDPELPLLISARFRSRDGFSRYVATIGGEQVMIRDEETDAWIQRALDERAKNAR